VDLALRGVDLGHVVQHAVREHDVEGVVGELECLSISETQVDVATARGSVFVVRDDGRTIVATTAPEPTAGLVFYDLKTCLRALDAPKPKRRRTKPKEPVDEA